MYTDAVCRLGRINIVRNSTSGYWTFVWGNVVTWKNNKSLSNTQLMAESACDIIWLTSPGINKNTFGPHLWSCNRTTRCSLLSHTLVQHDKAKHIVLTEFHKREGRICIFCMRIVPMSQQIPNILMKGLFQPN